MSVTRFEDIGEDNEIYIVDNRENKELGYWEFFELVNNINFQNEMQDHDIKHLKEIVEQDKDDLDIFDELKDYLDTLAVDNLY